MLSDSLRVADCLDWQPQTMRKELNLARNVEIKARLENLDQQLEIAKRLSSQTGETIVQRDVFFHCQSGRLKLRIFSPQHGQLIAYQRPDQAGPKTSEYCISETVEPETLREALTKSLGEYAEVNKTRLLFLVGRTRIHLDRVDALGDFLELEVVLSEDDDIADGQAEAQRLMEQLQVGPEALINCAYVDLLSTK